MVEVDTEKQASVASAHRAGTSLPTSNGPEMPRPTRGYAQLAGFMTKTRHGMLGKFKDLSTQNLLYLPAELYQLKFGLDRETAADAQCQRTDERSNWDFHWRLLATSGQRARVDDKRWKIWLNLRERLYEIPWVVVICPSTQIVLSAFRMPTAPFVPRCPAPRGTSEAYWPRSLGGTRSATAACSSYRAS